MTNPHDTVVSPTPKPEHQLDLRGIRRQFPALRQLVHGKPLAYLDNAATTQKPMGVIEALAHHYERNNANVHRGVHTLGVRATEAYEDARARVAAFLGARAPGEIVFTRGTTEAINLVAASWARSHLHPGDEIVVTAMEHHANLLPWRRLCEERGTVLRVVPIDETGALRVDEYARLLGGNVKLVAVAHASNALGTLNPIAKMATLAHAVGAVVLIDGALAAAHTPVDVAALGCDFYACSAHKIYGPTGVGALYAKAELLAEMPPWQTGGEMVLAVEDERIQWADPPYRFEAGTPPVAEAIAFAHAIAWLDDVGLPQAGAHERELLRHATERLAAIDGVQLVGATTDRVAVVSFVLPDLHAHDVATVLDDAGIAVRAGDQCAQPLMRALGVPGTVRASFATYNTLEEVDRLADGVARARTLLG